MYGAFISFDANAPLVFSGGKAMIRAQILLSGDMQILSEDGKVLCEWHPKQTQVPVYWRIDVPEWIKQDVRLHMATAGITFPEP